MDKVSIPVRHVTGTVGPGEPAMYAEVGDTVTVRGDDGGLIRATLVGIDGARVTVRHLHDDTEQTLDAGEVVGVIHT